MRQTDRQIQRHADIKRDRYRNNSITRNNNKVHVEMKHIHRVIGIATTE